MGVLATPGKRILPDSKPEPSSEGPARTAHKKARRLCDKRHGNKEPVGRPRLQTITKTIQASGGGRGARHKRRQRNNSIPVFDPKQTLLPMLWINKESKGACQVSSMSTSGSGEK